MTNTQTQASPASCKLYTIAWVAALAVELAAAEAMLDARHDEPRDYRQHPCDQNQYTWGRVGAHHVVIVGLPAGIWGVNSAAVATAHLTASLPQVKMGMLVGIGGGIPQITKAKDANGVDVESVSRNLDIRLGDVVVGQPDGTCGGVVQYDLGKARLGQVWERKGSLNSPPAALLNAIAKLESAHLQGLFKMPSFLAQMWDENPYMATAHGPEQPSFKHQGLDNDRLFTAEYGHESDEGDCRLCKPPEQVRRPGRDTTSPQVHYGVIASGNRSIEDAGARDGFAQSTGQKCICYDTVAAGVLAHLPCLVIRGISDYADSHRNRRWQPYASATAAAYAKEVLYSLSPRPLAAAATASPISALRDSIDKLRLLSQAASRTPDGLLDAAEAAAKQRLLSRQSASAETRCNAYTTDSSPLCLGGACAGPPSEISNRTREDGSLAFAPNAMARTGKSAIPRTFAEMSDDRHQPGACFLCKRDEADGKNAGGLCSTMGTNLVPQHPMSSREMLKATSYGASIDAEAAREPFTRLALDPMSWIRRENPVLWVIDALDGCDDEELKTLLGLDYN